MDDKNDVKIKLIDEDGNAVDKTILFTFRCEELESIDISSWKLKKCENVNDMFKYCYNLKQIIGEDVLKEIYDKKIAGYNNMFTDCKTTPSWYKHWNA